MKRIFTLFLFTVISAVGISQTNDSVDIFDMNLEQLLNLEVDITNVDKASKIFEAPGIVTIITEEEIRNSGANDLIDVLRTVPGFNFGVDVISQVGIINRGNWAHEGKILVMIDGQMTNEMAYATTQFGFHYPVENIKRIEIIRGPGSAIYGGFAELSVINIITKKGRDLNLVTAGTSVNITQNIPLSGYNTFLNAGFQKNNFELSFFVRYGDFIRSDRTYTDFNGDAFNTAENIINPTHFNMDLRYKNLNVNAIFDNYHTTSRDYFGTNLSKAYSKDFIYQIISVSDELKISDKLKVTPSVSYIRNYPWISPDYPEPADTATYYNNLISMSRIKSNLKLAFNPNKFIDLAAGLEYYIDNGKKFSDDPDDVFWNEQKTISYNTIAAFTQADWYNKFFKTTIGFRYEKQSQYGGAFVPRISLLKNFDKLYIKLLYNKAFRSPTIENIDYNYSLHTDLGQPVIKPEFTDVYNAEIGYYITPNIFMTLNLFKIDIKDAIIYFVDEDGSEGYENLNNTGTYGIESELKLKYDKFYANMNLSFATSKNSNEIAIYKVTSVDYVMLGSPLYKITASLNYKFNKKISVNSTSVFLSERYGYEYSTDINYAKITEFQPALLTNFNFLVQNLFKNFDFSIGVHNILNTEFYFIQPYDGGHAPLPDRSRMLTFKIQYSLKKNN